MTAYLNRFTHNIVQPISRIVIEVELNENKVPQSIKWSTTDPDNPDFQDEKEAKTLMLSLWDEKEFNTLSLNLWNPKMTVPEMNIHIFQIIKKLSEVYVSASKDKSLESLFIQFGNEFAQKTKIVDSSENTNRN